MSGVKKICNQLLCDLAYVRVWDNYDLQLQTRQFACTGLPNFGASQCVYQEPAEKLNKEFADAGAPNAMLVAGNQAVFVCLMPIIHEDG